MKRIASVLPILVLTGCVTSAPRTQSDMTYEPINDRGTVGVRARSEMAGITVDVFAFCDADRRQYYIDPTSEFRAEQDRWILKIDGDRFWRSDLKYDDDGSFLASLKTLEAVGPKVVFGEPARIQVAGAEMLKLPEICRNKQKQEIAYLRDGAERESQKNESLISEVVSRTGVKPMLSGRNEKDFNNLVTMFRSFGVKDFVGKFVWVEDGDYFVSQILNGEVLLTSLTNPSLFPPISIVTDKQALEGQPWSSVSRGPLQFVGPKQYQTVLGVERQVLVFKSI